MPRRVRMQTVAEISAIVTAVEISFRGAYQDMIKNDLLGVRETMASGLVIDERDKSSCAGGWQVEYQTIDVHLSIRPGSEVLQASSDLGANLAHNCCGLRRVAPHPKVQ